MKTDPSIDDLISLEVPAQSKACPDGSKVAYTVRVTDWNRNVYENRLFVHYLSSGDSFQLTRSGDVTDFLWSGDRDLYVLRADEKAQVYLFEGLTGEPLQVTDHESGVQGFKLSDEGVMYLTDDPEVSKRKETTDRYGNVVHFEMEESASAIYYTEAGRVKEYKARVMGLTEDEAKELPKPVIKVTKDMPSMKVTEFYPSMGVIYLNSRPRDPLVYSKDAESHIMILHCPSALSMHLDGGDWMSEHAKLKMPEQGQVAAVSPDGVKLLVSYRERDRMMYTQSDLYVIRTGKLAGDMLPEMEKITGDLDRGIMGGQWVESGIYVSYVDECITGIAKIGEDGTVSPVDLGDVHSNLLFDVSSGGYLSFVGANREKLYEVYVTPSPVSDDPSLVMVTDYDKQIQGWDMGVVEVIEWESKDGTMIQGILRKPSDFDPTKKYPLLFDVHGGPSWFSRDVLLEAYDYARYPVVQFNNKDVLILKPNYRGSIGRGQWFRELNVDNLGVGDLWDLESGIDHLDKLGYIDTEKVGCMGWSQGGYISAMAGLRSNRFKAVSVGAGISDWYTYHISNDIPHFTDHYLSANPWENREVYEKTAPIAGIETADTPTLIQHGGKDNRVPLSNGMEIYRALKPKGVPVELYVYPEMAHPITKPRECRAVSQQNLDWFMNYLVNSS